MKSGIAQYRNVNAYSAAESAEPLKLIVMLYDGAVERIAFAKTSIENHMTAEKSSNITRAMAIISGLKSSLDLEAGGEVGQNLFSLYEYCEKSLLEANMGNDTEKLDEVINILKTVKEGWENIKH